MPKGKFHSLVHNVRLDSKQRALQSALLVPWRELAASADEYVEWHAFVLWVRTIDEAIGDIPDDVRSELQTRCPGLLDAPAKDQPIWKVLEAWITAERFANANAGGWFEAMTYYAYKDMRVEQAWSLWKRAKADWRHTPPTQWPTFDQWKVQITATYALPQGATEKARVLAAMKHIDRHRLRSAVDEVVELRAVILWADCLSKPDQPIDPVALAVIERRCPAAIDVIPVGLLWRAPALSRLIRRVDSEWRETARRERWYAALRYHV